MRALLIVLAALIAVSTAQVNTPNVRFSVDRGFYEDSFDLVLTVSDETAQILYTVSDPFTSSETTLGRSPLPIAGGGTVYSAPISITKSTIIRALSWYPNLAASSQDIDVETHTYIFAQNVIDNQDDSLLETIAAGDLPGTDGEFTGSQNHYYCTSGFDAADSGLSDSALLAAFYSRPAISLVGGQQYIWGSALRGDRLDLNDNAFESSIELIYPRLGDSPYTDELLYPTTQEDGGVSAFGPGRDFGGFLDRKRSLEIKFSSTSFDGAGRIGGGIFRSAVFGGESEPNRYDLIRFRSGFWDSWTMTDDEAGADLQSAGATYMMGPLVRETNLLLNKEEAGARTTYVNLFINGQYWGVYQAAERVDDQTFEVARGVDRDLLDTFTEGSTLTGTQWSTVSTAATGSSWNAVSNLLDAQKLINARLTEATLGVGLIEWIATAGLDSYTDSYGNGRLQVTLDEGDLALRDSMDSTAHHDWDLNSADSLGVLFDSLFENHPEFRRLFYATVQEHLIDAGGLLTDDEIKARIDAHAAALDDVMPLEVARWGDERASVSVALTNLASAANEYRGRAALRNSPENPYDVADWTAAVAARKTALDFNGGNADDFVADLRTRTVGGIDLFPALDAPTTSQGSVVYFTGSLTVTVNHPGGSLKFTTDGSDPATSGTAVTTSGTSTNLEVDASTWFRGFVVSGTSDPDSAEISRRWIRTASLTDNLRLTEIMYNPANPPDVAESRSQWEFLEFKNIGTSTIDLSGSRFGFGVTYEWPWGTTIAPGEYKLVVADETVFDREYADFVSLRAAGRWYRTLSNRGDFVTIRDASGTEVLRCYYDDEEDAGWDKTADGDGYSLVSGDDGEGDCMDPEYWRASSEIGGSPGEADPLFSTARLFVIILIVVAGLSAIALAYGVYLKTQQGSDDLELENAMAEQAERKAAKKAAKKAKKAAKKAAGEEA